MGKVEPVKTVSSSKEIKELLDEKDGSLRVRLKIVPSNEIKLEDLDISRLHISAKSYEGSWRDNIKLENCDISNIHLSGFGRVKINNCCFNGEHRIPLRVERSNFVKVKNSNFEKRETDKSFEGMNFSLIKNVEVNDIIMEEFGEGIRVEESNLSIRDCTFESIRTVVSSNEAVLSLYDLCFSNVDNVLKGDYTIKTVSDCPRLFFDRI